MPPNHPLPKIPTSIRDIDQNFDGLALSTPDRVMSPGMRKNLNHNDNIVRRKSAQPLIPKQFPGGTTPVRKTPVNSTISSTINNPISMSNSQHQIGYNGYGSYMHGGLGMMGMNYPGMYGMGLNPFMGPMAFMANINYMILGVGQMISMLGMSSSMFVGMFQSLIQSFRQLEATLRQSSIRRWFQLKSKKSSIFRLLVVLSTMAIVGSASKLVKDVLKTYLNRSITNTSALIASAASAATNVVSTSSTVQPV